MQPSLNNAHQARVTSVDFPTCMRVSVRVRHDGGGAAHHQAVPAGARGPERTGPEHGQSLQGARQRTGALNA